MKKSAAVAVLPSLQRERCVLVADIGGRRSGGHTEDSRVTLTNVSAGFPALKCLLVGTGLCIRGRTADIQLIIAPVQRRRAVQEAGQTGYGKAVITVGVKLAQCRLRLLERRIFRCGIVAALGGCGLFIGSILRCRTRGQTRLPKRIQVAAVPVVHRDAAGSPPCRWWLPARVRSC